MSLILSLPLLLSAQPVATDSYLPTLPTIVQTLESVGTSLTAFALTFDIGQLPMSSLADRFGRRQVLLIGPAYYILTVPVDAPTTIAPMLTTACTLQGFSMAAVLVYTHTAIRDLHLACNDLHVMAHGLTGFGLVVLMVPTLGAFVVQHTGWRWVLVGTSFYAIMLRAMCWHSFAKIRHKIPAQMDSVRAIFSGAGSRAWGLFAAVTYVGIFCFLLLSPMVYIAYPGLPPELYGWTPAGGSLTYILSTAGHRRLLCRQSLVRTVQQGAAPSVVGACIQALSCWLLSGHVWLLLIGHAIYYMGHSVHQFYGRAGAVGELPHLAGCVVSRSDSTMMLVAFCLGQTAAAFDDTLHNPGA